MKHIASGVIIIIQMRNFRNGILHAHCGIRRNFALALNTEIEVILFYNLSLSFYALENWT